MPYDVKLLTGIEKQLRKMPSSVRERLVESMRSLALEPRPEVAVHLTESLYRVRVGSYRIIYAVFDADVVVLVCKVARRTEATYKNIRALLKRAKDTIGDV